MVEICAGLTHLSRLGQLGKYRVDSKGFRSVPSTPLDR
nr:hypothetical protein [Tanacetum cinerariifolium]